MQESLSVVKPRTDKERLHLYEILSKNVPIVGDALSESLANLRKQLFPPWHHESLPLPSPAILDRLGVSSGNPELSICYLVVGPSELSHFMAGTTSLSHRARGSVAFNEVSSLLDRASQIDTFIPHETHPSLERMLTAMSKRPFISQTEHAEAARAKSAWIQRSVSYAELLAAGLRPASAFWSQVGEANPDAKLFSYSLTSSCGGDSRFFESHHESFGTPAVTGVFLWISGRWNAADPRLRLSEFLSIHWLYPRSRYL